MDKKAEAKMLRDRAERALEDWRNALEPAVRKTRDARRRLKKAQLALNRAVESETATRSAANAKYVAARQFSVWATKVEREAATI
jgi:hypothetical protein